MNDHANKCIECTVRDCAHHCQNENYCSLDKILVGTEAPVICPTCNHPQAYFEVHAENY